MSKVVLITGGSSGLGKEIGNFLSQKNYTVYGTSRNPSRYQDQTSFPLVQLDVNDPNSIQTAVSEVLETAGKIDVLINNAGVGITGPMEETPAEEIQNAFNTNYFGPVAMIKAVLPGMRKQQDGTIINVTSIAGYMGLPYRGYYSAAKGALEITTEAFRMELRQFGIRMTNIAPGDFATNIAAGRYHAPLKEDSPYFKPYGETLKTMNEHVDAGMDPAVMAKKVYEVLQKDHPKVRYRVGSFLQKFSIVLKRILPGKTYERMLMNHYKLK